MEFKTSFGTNSKINKETTIFGEYRIDENSNQTKKSNVIGVDFSPLDKWIFSLDYSLSDVIDKSKSDFSREIIGLGVSYNKKNLKTKSRLEYRKDVKVSDLIQIVINSRTTLEI
ncbi:MAG: hypothetical protein U5K53_08620 [Halanaerobiales bacterium]|nr:hypothetical protein [Halanaerobiales bacterium]